jgi:hypothetical protein
LLSAAPVDENRPPPRSCMHPRTAGWRGPLTHNAAPVLRAVSRHTLWIGACGLRPRLRRGAPLRGTSPRPWRPALATGEPLIGSAQVRQRSRAKNHSRRAHLGIVQVPSLLGQTLEAI